MTAVGEDTAAILRRELLHPELPHRGAATLAASLVEARGDAVAAILFYGSCLRDPQADGILDFYVVVDDYRRYHGGRLAAALNRLLPPTVSLLVAPAGTRAKVAVKIGRAHVRNPVTNAYLVCRLLL